MSIFFPMEADKHLFHTMYICICLSYPVWRTMGCFIDIREKYLEKSQNVALFSSLLHCLSQTLLSVALVQPNGSQCDFTVTREEFDFVIFILVLYFRSITHNKSKGFYQFSISVVLWRDLRMY